MPKANKKWFIIKAGSAQVYSHPDFNSPCITEAIYGESCRILGHKDNWFKIECEDGYIGWVNSFYGIRSLQRNNPKYLVVYPKNGGYFNSKYPFAIIKHLDVKFNEKLEFKSDNAILKIKKPKWIKTY